MGSDRHAFMAEEGGLVCALRFRRRNGTWEEVN